MKNEDKSKMLGQYFTDEDMVSFMVKLVSPLHKTDSVLEPSCGKGVFLKHLLALGYQNVVGYEVDATLAQESHVKDKIVYRSFVSEEFGKRFKLSIGNPPYVRWKHLSETARLELVNNALWKKYCNALCDFLYIFILKSVELLDNGGQLIFITPSYWFFTTHGRMLRNYLVANGSFERIYCFNETPIFKKVSSSIAVFKYVKGRVATPISIVEYNGKQLMDAKMLDAMLKEKAEKNVEYYSIPAFERDKPWVFAPPRIRKVIDSYENVCQSRLGEICDICNGMVTGLDKAFQIPQIDAATMREREFVLPVVKATNLKSFVYTKTTPYIFAQDIEPEERFLRECPTFASLLAPFRAQLAKRYAYGREIHYWQWVFLRNYETLKRDEDRIFVPCKERLSSEFRFRFALVPKSLYPTQDVTALLLKKGLEFKEGMWFLVTILNSRQVFDWTRYKGIVKGKVVEFSEAPLGKIPIKRIDWHNKREVKIYKTLQSLYANKQWNDLQQLVDQLLD